MNGVMNETITYGRFMNNTVFRVEHMKFVIRTMPICAAHKFLVKRKDVVFKVTFEG